MAETDLLKLALIGILLLTGTPLASAYETDQFSNRLEPIEDSTDALNARVNDTVREAARECTGARHEMCVVNFIYHRIGGRHWVDKLERWAMRSPKVDRLSTARRDSIYAGQPLWATRFAGMFGVGPTIKMNGVLVGSDKIGHFLSQGRKFYRRWRRTGSEAQAAERSAFTERAIFGQLTTGSYSNADLVANYEGHLFYRSLFEDEVVPGKKAILRWEDGRWRVQRPFDFADHVNAYWDEALNISHFDRLLYPHMRDKLLEYCDDYARRPTMYRIQNEPALREKYGHLQLRPTSELRLYRLCEEPTGGAASMATFETGR